MAITVKDLPYPKTGDRPSHTDVTRLSDAVAYLSRQVGGMSLEGAGSQRGPWVAIEQFIGIIRDDDAPAALYYVERSAFPSGYATSDIAVAVKDQMFAGVVLATNQAELTADTPPVAKQCPPLATGQQVQVTRWMSRADVTEAGDGKLTVSGGTFLYTFYCAPPTGIFVVNLVQTGGTDGTSSAYATWTYDVYTRYNDGSSGDKLAGPLTPVRPRFLMCSMLPADVGTAYYDSIGDVALFEACERANQMSCT